MYEIEAKIGANFFKTYTMNLPYLSQNGHRIHFTKQNSSLRSLHGKIGNQFNNYTVYTSKEKNSQFSSLKKPSATKHSPPSNVYYMEFHLNFLTEYSLIQI